MSAKNVVIKITKMRILIFGIVTTLYHRNETVCSDIVQTILNFKNCPFPKLLFGKYLRYTNLETVTLQSEIVFDLI